MDQVQLQSGKYLKIDEQVQVVYDFYKEDL